MSTTQSTQRAELLAKHQIKPETFERACISWEELNEIARDHLSRQNNYQDVLDLVLRRLARIPGVHSTRGRIKDSEHLIVKCIRKRPKYHDLGLDNYRRLITDLIGVRALHLYKSNWIGIHKQLTMDWKHIQKPKAYVRDGDDTAVYRANKCKLENHDKGYRSVHYVVSAQAADANATVEIQVRTLFEEAWSEIDHLVRYPQNDVNPALEQFLNLFNRVAGTSDEMGSYVGTIRHVLDEATQRQEDLLQQLQITKEENIKQLQDQVSLTKATEEEKRRLLATIEKLKAPSGLETAAKIAGGISAGFLAVLAATGTTRVPYADLAESTTERDESSKMDDASHPDEHSEVTRPKTPDAPGSSKGESTTQPPRTPRKK